MKVNTRDDAKRAASRLNLDVGAVLSALGFNNDEQEKLEALLAKAIARRNANVMRRVYYNSTSGSPVEAKALKALEAFYKVKLADAIKRNDVAAIRWVYNRSPSGSPAEAKALGALLAKAIARKNANAIQWVCRNSPIGSPVEAKAIRALVRWLK